jgi:perosamine synthetase
MGDRFIPVAAPVLYGNEKKYVMDCLESTWISSTGKYLDKFEAAFAELCDAKYAIACCNGTVALHLALMALGVGPGDEVIVPTLTFVATANAVRYCGATPIFVDSEFETWNIDPAAIEGKLTSRTKGIIAVHLYGHPADMDAIQQIADRYNLFIIEDAAEAHGARYKGRVIGTLSQAATFSFYGNKIVTTGEGGMVITNDEAIARHVRQLKGQGVDSTRRYWFPIIGYNYRMTNVAAAIGLAQLEKVDWHLTRRLEVAELYKETLKDVPGISWQAEKEWAHHVYWMFSILLDKALDITRDEVMCGLQECGIETRPVFYPMHVLPPYCPANEETIYPVAETIASRGFSLPTWAGLNREDVKYVCESLLTCLSAQKIAK